MTIRAKPTNTLNALNALSWEWLQENLPDLAEAIHTDVGKHCTPENIFYSVLDQVGTDRRAIALRCRQAAEYLTSGSGE